MKIRADQLAARLTKASDAAIWLTGDEPLQMRDCSDLVRRHCRDKGFTEREAYDVDHHFNWGLLLAAGQSMSLFAEKKLIELRLRSAKLDDAARKLLIAYLSAPPPDTVLLMTSPRLDSSATRTQWYRQIEEKCLVVPLYAIDPHRLPEWIVSRAQQRGLQIDPDAVQLLADRVEGNMLAADQEIEKLSLLFGAGRTSQGPSQPNSPADDARITVQRIARSVADTARFTVFNLIDACLAGQGVRAIRSLRRLRDEGSEPLMILGMMVKEVRLLTELRLGLDRGQSLDGLMQHHRVWKNRQTLISTAVRRLRLPQLQAISDQCRLVDLAVKGMDSRPAWLLLEQTALRLSEIRSPSAPAQSPAHA